MRSSILFAALFCGAPALALADAAGLAALHALARANDAHLAAAQAAHRASLERLPQSRANLLPNVNLSAYLRQNHSDSAAAGTRDYASHGYALSLLQPIYRKQNLEAFEQARLQVTLAEQQLKLAEQELVLRVARAYFDVLEAEDALATARAQKAAIAEQLAQARMSFEVGAATIVDTHEAQARFNATQAQEISAENQLEVRRRALERILQMPAPKLRPLSVGVTLPAPTPGDMESWVRAAEENSLSVQMAHTAAEIARREIERQRSGYRPTLDLAANFSDSRNGGAIRGDSRSASIGLELNWNLYQGGATDSRMREAVANQEKTHFELDAARRQAALDARAAFLGVMSGIARVRALEQAVASSETQLKSTKLGLEVGVRTRVDVLNAQQQLYAAQRDLAAARYATLYAGLQLKAAAGALSEGDLTALDQLLVRN